VAADLAWWLSDHPTCSKYDSAIDVESKLWEAWKTQCRAGENSKTTVDSDL